MVPKWKSICFNVLHWVYQPRPLWRMLVSKPYVVWICWNEWYWMNDIETATKIWFAVINWGLTMSNNYFSAKYYRLSVGRVDPSGWPRPNRRPMMPQHRPLRTKWRQRLFSIGRKLLPKMSMSCVKWWLPELYTYVFNQDFVLPTGGASTLAEGTGRVNSAAARFDH